MSIDPNDRRDTDLRSQNDVVVAEPVSRENDCESLIARLRDRAPVWEAHEVFGPAAKDGAIYRWGIAVSTGSACDDLVEMLSRLACGVKLSGKRLRSFDWNQAASDWCERISRADRLQPVDGALGALWAGSLPSLTDHLAADDWHRVLVSLLDLHQSVLQQSDPASPLHLMIGGEMGLTLAIGLPEFPQCARLQAPSLNAVHGWCRADAESISAAVASAVEARLVLASWLRTKRMVSASEMKPFDKAAWKEMGECLATWVAAMTTYGGGSALSPAGKSAVVDDLVPDGLLDHAAKFDTESLKPAIAAAMGATPTGGRLAWQVSLPESMHHDPDAKFAVLFPEWDVRRGRTHVDYSGPETKLELYAGRAQILSGRWETSIELDGQSQHPSGPWQEVCEYTDDDVHYLEIEQNWSGGLLLQRQIMLIRDDRCVLLADAVLPDGKLSEAESAQATASIRYTSRIPLAPQVEVEPEEETRELVLANGRRRAMVLPLAASEWRVGGSSCILASTSDQHLETTAQGKGCLYAPLWFDLQQRRFKRNRTWRQLTITDQLRIVRNDEAVGYRIQVGSEQWMVYRSLADSRCRSVLGKHLIADFYCSRFDSGDGGHEELITVDDGESSDE